MLPTKFRFIWPSSFRGEDFFKSANQKQEFIHILIFFLANLATGNMSFCHHLVSVVCHPFTFHSLIFSSENPRPNELKLGRKHLYLLHYISIS
jgi:hypothetical protein